MLRYAPGGYGLFAPLTLRLNANLPGRLLEGKARLRLRRGARLAQAFRWSLLECGALLRDARVDHEVSLSGAHRRMWFVKLMLGLLPVMSRRARDEPHLQLPNTCQRCSRACIETMEHLWSCAKAAPGLSKVREAMDAVLLGDAELRRLWPSNPSECIPLLNVERATHADLPPVAGGDHWGAHLESAEVHPFADLLAYPRDLLLRGWMPAALRRALSLRVEDQGRADEVEECAV